MNTSCSLYFHIFNVQTHGFSTLATSTEYCRYDDGGIGMRDEAMKQTGMKNWRMNLQWGRLHE